MNNQNNDYVKCVLSKLLGYEYDHVATAALRSTVPTNIPAAMWANFNSPVYLSMCPWLKHTTMVFRRKTHSKLPAPGFDLRQLERLGLDDKKGRERFLAAYLAAGKAAGCKRARATFP